MGHVVTDLIDWILDRLADLAIKLGIVAASFMQEWLTAIPEGQEGAA